MAFSLLPRAPQPTGVVATDAFDITVCTRCGDAGALASRCDHCSELLCHGCLPYEAHECAEWRAREQGRDAAPSAKANVPSFVRCSFPGCKEIMPVAMLCTYCREPYCSAHKVEGDHSCEAWKRKAAEWAREAEQRAAARKRLLPPSAQTQSVVAPKGLHVDDRFSLTVLTPPHLGLANPRKVAVNRHHSVGKVCDWLAEALGVPRGGAMRRLALLRARDLKQLPMMLVPVKELCRRGDLAAGDSVLLVPHDWCGAGGAELLSCAAQEAAADPAWQRVLDEVVLAA